MTDAELLRLIDSEIEGPACTAGEISELVDMTEEGVRNRLEKLHRNGKIGRKKPGPNTVMYFSTKYYKSSKSEAYSSLPASEGQ